MEDRWLRLRLAGNRPEGAINDPTDVGMLQGGWWLLKIWRPCGTGAVRLREEQNHEQGAGARATAPRRSIGDKEGAVCLSEEDGMMRL
jgi:hypothetical protein